MYEIKKLYDNLYVFTERGVHCFLIIGAEKSLLIDTGHGSIDFAKELPVLTDLPTLLVNTHGDPDHIGCNPSFTKRYVHEKELPFVQSRQPNDSGDYRFIKDGDIFDLGGITLEVLEYPGHTPGSIMLYDRLNRRLFPGDNIGTVPIFMFGPHRNHSDYISSLQKLLETDLDIKEVLPSHGTYPLNSCRKLTEDIIAALLAYSSGEPATSIESLHFGPVRKKVKLYIHGEGQVFTEQLSCPFTSCLHS